jgi:succinyl-CoA:acetate CoA-transferase
MKERVRSEVLRKKIMSAEKASQLIKNGMTVGTSGFTPAGYPKAVPLALAKRAKEGERLKINLITGASVGEELDGELAKAGVVERRYPYQTNGDMRNKINSGDVKFSDIHLSHMPRWIKYGFFGNIDVAVIEAVALNEDGSIVPSTSIGCSNALVEKAEKVIVEINTSQPIELEGIHDVYDIENPPHTKPIPLTKVEEKIGVPYIKCPIDKIAAVVVTDIKDSTRDVAPIDEDSKIMAQHIVNFIVKESKEGKLPEKLLPLQSGVGSVANAILGGLKETKFQDLEIYSEVLQDSVFDLMDAGKIKFASGTSLTISPNRLEDFYKNLHKYRRNIILRPEEISNNPEIIRRLGVIAMNTAIEFDIYGNVNSTNISGSRMMNGIGGSGDFARNAYLSIFMTKSTAKGGDISSIVPFVKHVDHTEHDVHVVVTEQGLADLRGLSPRERSEKIIENCVHPKFKEHLRNYVKSAEENCKYKHTPHNFNEAFKS